MLLVDDHIVYTVVDLKSKPDLEQPLVPVGGRVVAVHRRPLLGLLQSRGSAPLTRALSGSGRLGRLLGHPGHFALEHVLKLLGHSDHIVLRLVIFVAILDNLRFLIKIAKLRIYN